MPTICSHFSSWLITSNFSSVTIFFRQFFTWIAVGDVDLRFSLMLIRKDNAVQVETNWAKWLYHHCNQSRHMTDRVTVSSCTASFLQKISVTTANHVKLKIIADIWKVVQILNWRKWDHVKPDLCVFICHADYFFFIEIYVVCVMRVNG